MTITQIAQQVVSDRSAVQIRYRAGSKGEPKQYDCKPIFTGRSKGWIVFDLTTAGAVMAVHNGLRDDLRAKLDIVPLSQVISFCWKMAA